MTGDELFLIPYSSIHPITGVHCFTLSCKLGNGRRFWDLTPAYRRFFSVLEPLADHLGPLLHAVYNGLVYARVVLHPEPRHNWPYVEEWLRRCEDYLASGHRVYFMMHGPNNQHCPGFAADPFIEHPLIHAHLDRLFNPTTCCRRRRSSTS